MRKYWPTIILGVVFLGLLIFVVYNIKSKPVEQNKIIFETQPNNIAVIDITSDRKVTLQRYKEGFKLLLPTEVPGNQENIRSIFDKASKIEYTSLISKNEKNLMQFGLQYPKAIVDIKLKNGSKKSFILGNQTPGQDGYYLAEYNKNDVYKVDYTIGDEFSKKIDDLIEKQILFGVKREKISKLEIINSKERYILKKVDQDWIYNNKKITGTTMNQIIDQVVEYKVDGILLDESSQENSSILTIIAYDNDVIISKVEIFNNDDDLYKVVESGINANYYITRDSYESLKNNAIRLFNDEIK